MRNVPWSVTFHESPDKDPVVKKVKSLDEASELAEAKLKEGGAVYCARIWEGSFPCNSLYWNGEEVIYYNALTVLPRKKAENLKLDEKGELVERIEITRENFSFFN